MREVADSVFSASEDSNGPGRPVASSFRELGGRRGTAGSTAEAAAALDHPGIVPLYGVGEHAGRH